MQLQKQISRKIGNKVYPKWLLVIPPDAVKELNWKEGQKLNLKIKNGKVTLIPK